MTDYSAVKTKLIMLLGSDAELYESSDLDGFVQNAVDCVAPTVDPELLGDSRVVYFCAAKALYELRLVESMGADYVTSFKAGDVSFSRSTSCLEQAEKLVAEARTQCAGIIGNDGFSFRAV